MKALMTIYKRWSTGAGSRGRTWLSLSAAAICLLAFESRAALESLCAEVRIEVSQDLALERQAFDANMRINNGLSGIALEKVGVSVEFRDADGNAVLAGSDPNDTNAFFFISLDSMLGISDVSGNGTVVASSSVDIHWLIIPAPGAGGASSAGVRYSVGATLAYELGGTAYTLDVSPDTIFVKPMPRLELDYFLPHDVYGDDALSEPVEPPLPFSLGLRVRNAGYGAAAALQIDSGQPEIRENEHGLLASFAIVDTEVNGRSVPDTLSVFFGDVPGGAAAVARWVMECSLSGRFVNFRADFAHADELGGMLTSLIDDVRAHTLVRDVLVDLGGRDAVRDFLAADGEAFKVYESDNIDSLVTNLSGAAAWTLVGMDGARFMHTLETPPAAGPLYVRAPYTNWETRTILSCVRSDGKRLPEANVWFSKTRERGDAPWEYAVNVFDVNGGGAYTLTIEDLSIGPSHPVLQPIGDKVVRVGDPLGLGFLATASDPNGTVPVLTTTPLPAGATFSTAVNGGNVEGTFSWQPQAGQEGIWPVKFTASDGLLSDEELVKIYVGRQGEGTNAAGIPFSLAGWTAQTTNVVASTTGDAARVQWAAVPGIGYDVYGSDDPYAPGSMAWTRLASNVTATLSDEEWSDSTLGTNRTWRLYQVTLAGEPAGSNHVWGVQRALMRGDAWTFVAVPFRGDRRLNQALGQALGEVLTGDGAGPCDGVGDEIYALESGGAWRVIWLDGAGVWREADGRPSTDAISDGQGLLVLRNAAPSAAATFTGAIGNDRSRQTTVFGGWNLLALSEGKDLALSGAFAGAGGGGPAGHAQQGQADQIVMWDETGTGYWLMFVKGWGAPYDGSWVDLITLTIPALKIRPGQVIYYYRQPSAGNMTVTY